MSHEFSCQTYTILLVDNKNDSCKMIFHFPPSKFLQQQVALYSQFSCLSLQKIALLLSSTHFPFILVKTVSLLS